MSGDLISISDFARSRNEQPQTVAKWIREHGYELIENGHKKMIDTNALWYRELDKKYPLPQPVIIGRSEEEYSKVLEDLSQAKSAIIMLQNELTEQKLLNAQNEATMMLLEDKKEHLEHRMQEQEQEQQRTKEELLEQEEENRKLKEEIDRLRNRSLFDRIFNK